MYAQTFLSFIQPVLLRQIQPILRVMDRIRPVPAVRTVISLHHWWQVPLDLLIIYGVHRAALYHVFVILFTNSSFHLFIRDGWWDLFSLKHDFFTSHFNILKFRVFRVDFMSVLFSFFSCHPCFFRLFEHILIGLLSKGGVQSWYPLFRRVKQSG